MGIPHKTITAAFAAPGGFRADTFTGTATGTYEPSTVSLAIEDARILAGYKHYNGYTDCTVGNRQVVTIQPEPSPIYRATVTLSCSQAG